MRVSKQILALSMLVLGTGLQACVNDPGETDAVVNPDYPAVGTDPITFTGTCVFATNTMTVTLNSGDVAIISMAPQNSNALLINGTACGNANLVNTKAITLAESGGTGPETVVLDYINGFFAIGSSTATNGVTANFGSDPNDKLQVRMPNQNSNTTLGVSALNVNGDAYKDVVFSAIPGKVYVSFGRGNDSFSALGDAIVGASFTGMSIVFGGDGNDVLRGGAGNDFLYGEDGDDFLNGEASAAGGADQFDGGNGNDTLSYAQRANDLVVSIGDPNTPAGETGENDVVNDSIENVYGGNGNDTLSGSPNSTLSKRLFGGPGNDTFLQSNTGGADSHDYLSGGAGSDTVSYVLRTITVTVTLDGTANDGSSGENDNILSDIENVSTGDGDDSITGNANNNVLSAGNGLNNINGMDGDDIFLQGGDPNNAGNDTIDGGNGIDTVDYSGRTAALTLVMDGSTASGDTGAGENDKIKPTVENIYGGSGADTITGTTANNYIVGNAGADVISAGQGDDLVDGGAGTDNVDCGPGNDICVDCDSNNVTCELQVP